MSTNDSASANGADAAESESFITPDLQFDWQANETHPLHFPNIFAVQQNVEGDECLLSVGSFAPVTGRPSRDTSIVPVHVIAHIVLTAKRIDDLIDVLKSARRDLADGIPSSNGDAE